MSEPAPKLAFWIHQLVEYLLGFLVLSQGLHSAKAVAVPLAGGLLLLALAATADGPLGAFRWVSRRTHQVLDMVGVAVLLVLAGAGFAAGAKVGPGAVVLAVVLLVVLVLRTNYTPRAPRKPITLPTSGEEVGRAAGKLAASGVKGVRALRASRKKP